MNVAFFLLLALTCAAHAMLFSQDKCQGDAPNYVLACLRHFFDANGDDALTPSEVEAGLLALTANDTASLYSAWSATSIFGTCDLNIDGVLDMDDWNNATRATRSGCLSVPLFYNLACWVCADNGFVYSP